MFNNKRKIENLYSELGIFAQINHDLSDKIDLLTAQVETLSNKLNDQEKFNTALTEIVEKLLDNASK